MAITTYPPDEPASQIFAEKAWLQGEILSSVFYGLNFNLFVTSVILIYGQIKRKTADRQQMWLLLYICILFSFETIFMVGTTAFTQFAFITDRNYPGGPAQVENDLFSIPIDEAANVAFVLGNWTADILIVWRCFVIYKGCRVPMYVVLALPVLLYIGSVVTGSLFLYQISTASVYSTPTVNWTIPYFSLSLALNILVTLAIVGRLLLYRRRIIRAMGPGHGSQYASIAAMIVESAAIYSSFSLLFLIPFAMNNAVSEIFLQALGGVQVCATLLIVLRVAQGRAWNNNSTTKLTEAQRRGPSGGSGPIPMSKISAMRFGTNPNNTTQATSTDIFSTRGPTETGYSQPDNNGKRYNGQVKVDHEVFQYSEGKEADVLHIHHGTTESDSFAV